MKWYDGYDGTAKTIVYDDFDGQPNGANNAYAIPFRTLLKLFDANPVNVEVKGSMVPYNPKWIVITTNLSPTEWYPLLSPGQREPLLRRLRERRRWIINCDDRSDGKDWLNKPWMEISPDGKDLVEVLDPDCRHFDCECDRGDAGESDSSDW